MALQFQQEWQRIQHLSSWRPKLGRRQLMLASGGLFSGALVLSMVPLAFGEGTSQPWQESLWRSTGLVRQTVVDLYRLERSQQTATASPEADAAPPDVTTTDAAAPATPTDAAT
ncbi:MAG: hypothetical protein AAFO87_12280, partial [Cyanobacteria bacterium J06607_6]